MRILIISSNAVGDTFLSASAIQTLLEIEQSVRIDFITNSSSSFMIKELPLNDVYILHKRNVLNVLLLFNSVRKNQYDYVFSFFPGRINTFFFKLAKGRFKAGFVNLIKIEDWHLLTSKLKVVPPVEQDYYWNPGDNYLKRIELCLQGVKIRFNRIKKPITSIGKSKGDKIVIAPFSNDARRELSTEQIIYLINSIRSIEKKSFVILFGDGDKEKILPIRKRCKSIEFANGHTLKELTSLISNNVLIAVDSFPIHIADANGSNFIGLFSITFMDSVLVNTHTSIKYDINSLSSVSQSRLSRDVLNILSDGFNNHE